MLGGREEARDHEDPHSRFVTPASGAVTRTGAQSQPPRDDQGGRQMYRAFGYLHARQSQLRTETGQGTVEYVALILLVALAMPGVLASMKGFKTVQGKDLGDAILGKIRSAVDKVEF